MKKSILIVLFILIFIPFKINALEYVEYSNVISDGESITSKTYYSLDELVINMKDKSNYQITITGYNLVSNENYTFSLKSDYKDYEVTYTGLELMNGITYNGTDGNSDILATVKKGENVISAKFLNNESYEKVFFKFNNNFNTENVDNYFNTISKSNILKIKSINPLSDEFFADTAISTAVKEYNNANYYITGGCDNVTTCSITITDRNNALHSKTYPITFDFISTNSLVKNKVALYKSKYDGFNNSNVMSNLYVMKDMEVINYMNTVSIYGDDIDSFNSAINYSTELQKDFENNNIGLILDARAGNIGQFTESGYGLVNFTYDGVIYGYADYVGIRLDNVLYIPDDTQNDREHFISSAYNKIISYLPNATVNITYKGQISSLTYVDVDDIIDVSKTIGEYYTISINGYSRNFFIVKDSSKYRTAVLNTVDTKTNISVQTSSYETPLDSKIEVNVYDTDSQIYKDLIKTLKLDNGKVVDLKVYSDSIDSYISLLSNGKFKVSIPIDNQINSNSLVAYYIDSNNNIEKYPITIKDGFAIFETNHFSTYTIGYVNNPNTSDNVINYIILSFVSLISIMLLSLFVKKFKN